jgi:hypothetical protein
LADSLDVSQALADLIAAEVYPLGPSGASALPWPVKIYPGWPDPMSLEADLTTKGVAPIPHISVFGMAMERNTTRYPTDEVELSRHDATFVVSRQGNAIIIGGAQAAPYRAQNVAVKVAGVGYAYRVLPGDTLATIAAGLRDVIGVDIPGATVDQATILFPTGFTPQGWAVGVLGRTSKEVGRQAKGYQITIWTKEANDRSTIGRLIEPVIRDTPRLALAGGDIAHLTYQSVFDDDKPQRQGLWARRLIYWAEFPTNREFDRAEMIVAIQEFATTPGGDRPATVTVPVGETLPVHGTWSDFSLAANSGHLAPFLELLS